MLSSALGGRRSSNNFPSLPVMLRDGTRQSSLLFSFTDWNTLDRSGKHHTNLPNVQTLLSCVWLKTNKKGLRLAPCVSASKDTLSLFLSPYGPPSRFVSPKFSEVNVLGIGHDPKRQGNFLPYSLEKTASRRDPTISNLLWSSGTDIPPALFFHF